MNISPYIFWSWLSIYTAFAICDLFHLSLWWSIFRGKRKFFVIKFTAHMWEESGQWNFNRPEIYTSKIRDFMASHAIKIGPLLVEELPTKGKTLFLAAVNEKGKRDEGFQFAARNISTTFHIDGELVSEKTKAFFTFRHGLSDYSNRESLKPQCGVYHET